MTGDYLKWPAASLSYSIDWTGSYLLNDTIAQTSWHLEPDLPGGMAIASSGLDGNIVSARVEGGLAGQVYRLVNTITLGSGDSDTRSITIRIGER